MSLTCTVTSDPLGSPQKNNHLVPRRHFAISILHAGPALDAGYANPPLASTQWPGPTPCSYSTPSDAFTAPTTLTLARRSRLNAESPPGPQPARAPTGRSVLSRP